LQLLLGLLGNYQKKNEMKKYVLALDLKPDQALIAAYEAHHKAVWPEVLAQIKASGIHQCDIYRVQNRLVMLLETSDDFSFGQKNLQDQNNPKVQAWESLMCNYQQALPGAKDGEKWMLMEQIFGL
jgi:L-rhamnose mutarotase